MGVEKTVGIVLRYADYRDNDRILTLLTREHGVISASARGCRRAKSPLMQGSELFVYGEFLLYKSAEKYRVDSVSVMETFYPVREDVRRLAAASYMAQLASEGAEDDGRGDEMLPLLLYALTYTAHSEADAADMATCFLAKYMRLMGYGLSVTHCALCGKDLRDRRRIRFAPGAGGALCDECAVKSGRAETELSALSLEALRRMLLLPDADIKKVRLPEPVRAELLPALNACAEHVFERRFKAFASLMSL